MLIENGASGAKTAAKVDLHNRMATTAVVGEYDFVINAESGKVWSIPFDTINPTGNDDYFIYIKNTGDKILHIPDIRLIGSGTSRVDVHFVSGTAAGGTDITPVSRTAGSAASLSGIVQSGSDITGLSSDGTVFFLQVETANKEYRNHTHSTIRLPKNKAIALLAKTGTVDFTGTITVVEEENGFA